MPATSFSGECFARAFGERPRRFALEIQDDEVAFGAQHLTEVIVAVDARPLPDVVSAPASARNLAEQTRRGD